MSDHYEPEDGPAFTKLDCGHWACCLDGDECGACRDEAQREAADEEDKWARERRDDLAYERSCDPDHYPREDFERDDFDIEE